METKREQINNLIMERLALQNEVERLHKEITHYKSVIKGYQDATKLGIIESENATKVSCNHVKDCRCHGVA